MSRPFWREHLPAIVIGLLDVFTIGLGMGVPFFTILFGFGVGWWLVRRPGAAIPADADVPRAALRSLLGSAAALAAVSFVVLLMLWGPAIPNAFDPTYDAAGWGIPLILYEPQASMIGWLALMIVISPVLQFMAAISAGVTGLAMGSRRRPVASAHEPGER